MSTSLTPFQCAEIAQRVFLDMALRASFENEATANPAVASMTITVAESMDGLVINQTLRDARGVEVGGSMS